MRGGVCGWGVGPQGRRPLSCDTLSPAGMGSLHAIARVQVTMGL